MSRHYAIGPWVFDESEESGAFWRAPAGAVGVLDLRGSESRNMGLFVTERPLRDSAYTEIGDGSDLRDYRMRAADMDKWRDSIGLSREECPDQATLYDALVWTFERCGDPEGKERFKPPTATHRGNLELHLGGHSRIWRRKFTGEADPAWPRIRALLRSDYERMHAEAERAVRQHERETPQRVLTDWMAKYRIADASKFVPAGMDARPLPRQTTISDDFNRSDRDLDGDGPGGWTWDVFLHSAAIVSNQVEVATGSLVAAIAASDLSSSDVTSGGQLAVATGDHTLYWTARWSGTTSANMAGYGAGWRQGSTENYLVRRQSGSSTVLSSDSDSRPSSLTEFSVTVDGSTIAGNRAGVEFASVTDTNISSGVRTGFYAYAQVSVITVDDFEAFDLEAATPIGPIAMHHYRPRRSA